MTLIWFRLNKLDLLDYISAVTQGSHVAGLDLRYSITRTCCFNSGICAELFPGPGYLCIVVIADFLNSQRAKLSHTEVMMQIDKLDAHGFRSLR